MFTESSIVATPLTIALCAGTGVLSVEPPHHRERLDPSNALFG